jgi:hypothetical protein
MRSDFTPSLLYNQHTTMKKTSPLQESKIESAPAVKAARRGKPPVSAAQAARQTTHRVSPSRASGRDVERHDQRRQPKRGRHKEGESLI